MTQPERWYERVIEHIRRRERTAVLRRQLAEARRLGKEQRNRERLAKRGAK